MVTITNTHIFVIIITLSIYIIYCYYFHDNMLECIECKTKLHLSDSEHNSIINCPGCGIELEMIEGNLISLQLGPSEE